ncbi:MAG: NADH-quinone oxidoreductase subunit C [Chloroflexi bacterium]|nr:NADH-quinone oxidoreductase subunit C [Chloroflexota bacterium]
MTALGPKEDNSLAVLLGQTLEGVAAVIEQPQGEAVVTVEPEKLVSLCRRLKEDPGLGFDYLRCLSAVDYGDHFQLVYHLYSMAYGHKMVVKVNIPLEDAVAPSVTAVWRGADWHEREAAEMFGITFTGHPHLVPLLLEEGCDEHPLCKSHPMVALRPPRNGDS